MYKFHWTAFAGIQQGQRTDFVHIVLQCSLIVNTQSLWLQSRLDWRITAARRAARKLDDGVWTASKTWCTPVPPRKLFNRYVNAKSAWVQLTRPVLAHARTLFWTMLCWLGLYSVKSCMTIITVFDSCTYLSATFAAVVHCPLTWRCVTHCQVARLAQFCSTCFPPLGSLTTLVLEVVISSWCSLAYCRCCEHL